MRGWRDAGWLHSIVHEAEEVNANLACLPPRSEMAAIECMFTGRCSWRISS